LHGIPEMIFFSLQTKRMSNNNETIRASVQCPPAMSSRRAQACPSDRTRV
jgi:hypothetical protein